MYSNGPFHTDEQVLRDQLEPIYCDSVQIQDVVLKTFLKRWMIEMNGEKGSGKSVLEVRHDGDIYIYIYIYMEFYFLHTVNIIMLVMYSFFLNFNDMTNCLPLFYALKLRIDIHSTFMIFVFLFFKISLHTLLSILNNFKPSILFINGVLTCPLGVREEWRSTPLSQGLHKWDFSISCSWISYPGQIWNGSLSPQQRRQGAEAKSGIF